MSDPGNPFAAWVGPDWLDRWRRLVTGPPPAGFAGTFWEALGAAVPGTAGLGPGRGTAKKVTHTFEAWLEMQRAAAAYQTIVAGAWGQACERFAAELAAGAPRGGGDDGGAASERELVTRFLAVAEATFADCFATDAYVQAQAKTANATMAYLAAERELVDAAAKLGHFPTRTEMDEAHRQIHELRREVRALRREVRRCGGKPEETP